MIWLSTFEVSGTAKTTCIKPAHNYMYIYMFVAEANFYLHIGDPCEKWAISYPWTQMT